MHGNGVGDSEDIASGGSADENSNGIPDECEFTLGDLNCDDNVNSYDIDGFVLAVSSYPDFDEYHQLYPECNPWMANCNHDGIVNSYDIDCFIDLVGGG
ncbi:MAG: hypothetical protein ABIG44_09735 [Planctomycetota bacterium]